MIGLSPDYQMWKCKFNWIQCSIRTMLYQFNVILLHFIFLHVIITSYNRLLLYCMDWARGTTAFSSIIIIIKIESAVQGRERVRTLYQCINPKTPTQHNLPMEGRKRENSRRQKERANYYNRRTSALLLKPASPTPSSTSSGH